MIIFFTIENKKISSNHLDREDFFDCDYDISESAYYFGHPYLGAATVCVNTAFIKTIFSWIYTQNIIFFVI